MEILKEVENHLIDVSQRIAEVVDDNSISNSGDWEVSAITIITGKSKEFDQQFHTLVNTKDMSVSEIIGTLEMVKMGVVNETLENGQ